MRIDKIRFWRGILSLAAVVLTFAVSSCTKEPLDISSTLSDDEVEVRVAFSRGVVAQSTRGTEEGTSDENRLDRVTILIFNENGTKLETVLSEDVTSSNTSLITTQPKWASEQTLLVGPLINPLSPKTIYAVANWSKTTFDKKTYTESMLKDELTTIIDVSDINGSKSYPMLMSGRKAILKITHFDNVTVEMERQVSKIKTLFTIPIDIQNTLSHIEWQTDLMKITVVNVPNKSYVIDRGISPADVALLNSGTLAVDDTKPLATDQTIPASKDLQWSESLYTTENILVGSLPANKDVSTHIVVQLPYKDRNSGEIDYDNYYKLYVNNTYDATTPHKVLRNTIYNFNIRIVGLGLPINNLVPDVNIYDILTVNSWENGEMGDVEFPQNSYLYVDRTYIGFQSFETSHRSTVVTDVADWKLVRENGTTIFSFAEGKTTPITIDGVTYTLSGDVSTATITVERVRNVLTIPTRKMFYTANNFKVPLTVTNDDGFIPKSVLLKYGWNPDNNLPANGLQIAKRGTSVQPNGMATLADPTMQWKTSNTYTDGTDKSSAVGAPGSIWVSLGLGASSTAAMAGAEHPAAQYCRDMGEGWFLPTLEELNLIWKAAIYMYGTGVDVKLGASYTFPYQQYWSSTQNYLNRDGALSMYMKNSNVLLSDKINSRSVRCVKAI